MKDNTGICTKLIEYPTMKYSNGICSQNKSLCLNNGVCKETSLSNNSYWCECASNYSGTRCENVLKEKCTTNKCVNGICVERDDIFSCICYEGWRNDSVGLCTERGYLIKKYIL
jgi:hypothetical protein